MKITARIETITPAKAGKYLATMVKNRKPKSGSVDAYANDMLAGKWLLSPQGIAFDDQGALFDGQHRLLAIRRAGVPVEMLVIRGFPARQHAGATMDVVDAGCGRSVADRLRLMGVYPGNPNLATGAARAIARIVMGPHSRAIRRMSIAAVVAIIEVYKKELSAVTSVMDRSSLRHIRNCHAVAAFTIAAAADVQAADRDMGRFANGHSLDADSPILALRNRMFAAEHPVPPRGRCPLILAALYATWTSTLGDDLDDPDFQQAAIDWFRCRQPERFEAVAGIFHVTD